MNSTTTKEPKYNVLIFEDDADQQILLKEILQKQGFSVKCVATSDLGLDLFGKTKFDAVLMDYKLAPESSLNGIETLEEIRKKNVSIPVLVLTGYATQELAIKSIKAKSDDFLVKPVDYSYLGSAIKESIIKKKQLFGDTPAKYEKKGVPLNFDLFKYFIVLKNSVPIYFKGQWGEPGFETSHSKNDLDYQVVMSSFLTIIKTLSKSLFGQSVNEVLLDNWKIIFKQKGAFLCGIKVRFNFFSFISENEDFKKTIITTLDEILVLLSEESSQSPMNKISDQIKLQIDNILLSRTSHLNNLIKQILSDLK